MSRSILIRLVEKACPGKLLYLAYRGSITYGTQREGSDIDFGGICLPPEEALFGLGHFEQKEFHRVPPEIGREIDGTVYEIRKFARLSLKGNPSLIELLFVQRKHMLVLEPSMKALFNLRHEFLSKRCYNSFCGYAWSQLRKMREKEYKNSKRRDEVKKYGYSLDNAYQLIRLLSLAIQLFTEGTISTIRPERQLLLSIRAGEVTLDRMEKLADEFRKRVDDAYVRTMVPAKPNYDLIDKAVIGIIKEAYIDRG